MAYRGRSTRASLIRARISSLVDRLPPPGAEGLAGGRGQVAGTEPGVYPAGAAQPQLPRSLSERRPISVRPPGAAEQGAAEALRGGQSAGSGEGGAGRGHQGALAEVPVL